MKATPEEQDLIDMTAEIESLEADLAAAQAQVAEARTLLELAHKAFLVCEGVHCPDAEHRIAQFLTAGPVVLDQAEGEGE